MEKFCETFVFQLKVLELLEAVVRGLNGVLELSDFDEFVSFLEEGGATDIAGSIRQTFSVIL